MSLTCHRVRCNGTLKPNPEGSEHLYQCDECDREALKEEPLRHYADPNGNAVGQLADYLLNEARGGGIDA